MKVNITGLGAIKSASIDLDKKITIFCGHNSTGKTYLSYALYAFLEGFPIRFHNTRPVSIDAQGSFSYKIDPKKIHEYLVDRSDSFIRGLDSVFGLSEEMAKQFFPNVTLSCQEDMEALTARLINMSVDKVAYGPGELQIEIHKNPGTLLSKCKIIRRDGRSLNHLPASIVIDSVMQKFYAFSPIGEAFILPVERNSIYTFKTELSISRNALVDQMQKLSGKEDEVSFYDMITQRSKRYPKAISDGLMIANDLSSIQKTRGAYYELAVELENELLNGTLSITKDGDVQFGSNKMAKSRRLPFHMGASIVKTLSSLIIYLKHIAKINDLIIIDEPEMNLHPDNQRVLAHVFARLANHGLRFLISTHSDYILREFNIMILASSKKQRVREEAERLGFTADYQIRSDEVGVYYFDYSGKRNVAVKPITIYENGFDVKSIDETIAQQNELVQTLDDLMYYGGE